jgi:hypothetical protein
MGFIRSKRTSTNNVKQRGGSKYKPMMPKPVVVAAFQPGCSTAQCSAHQLQLNRDNMQNDMNKQHGGDADATTPAPITCPQVAMHGMQSTPNNSNQQSCDANGTKAQGHTNAQYDNQVGKLPPKTLSGGSIQRRLKSRTSKRRTSKRRTNKRRTNKRRTSKRRTNKRRTSKRRTSKRRTSKP